MSSNFLTNRGTNCRRATLSRHLELWRCPARRLRRTSFAEGVPSSSHLAAVQLSSSVGRRQCANLSPAIFPPRSRAEPSPGKCRNARVHPVLRLQHMNLIIRSTRTLETIASTMQVKKFMKIVHHDSSLKRTKLH